jgi:hypothetical protein
MEGYQRNTGRWWIEPENVVANGTCGCADAIMAAVNVTGGGGLVVLEQTVTEE